MIDEFFFDQPVKNYQRAYDSIRIIATGQGDDDTTGCLLHYVHFLRYKMIAIDLSKQEKIDADQKQNNKLIFLQT